MNDVHCWQAFGESLKTSVRTKTRLGQIGKNLHRFYKTRVFCSDDWRREGWIESFCLPKIGAGVRIVRWENSEQFASLPGIRQMCYIAFGSHKKVAVLSSMIMKEQPPFL